VDVDPATPMCLLHNSHHVNKDSCLKAC